MVRSHRLHLWLLVLLLLSMSYISALPMTSCAHEAPATPPNASGPLCALNGHLVDVFGQEVRLTGINWYGMETGSFAPGGLDVRNWQDMLDQMVRVGFNTLRLPFSNQFLDDSINQPQGINYDLNPDLVGLHGLSLLDRLIEGAHQRGLKVILDRHRPTAAQQTELWYTDQVPESRWIADWVMLAKHYRGESTVIGADLHGEPHGPATWGSGDLRTDWRLAAERAGNAILAANPDWLIIVEGIEHFEGQQAWWGGNLAGADQYPVELSHPDKLVYSAHDYGPEVYPQHWFYTPNFPENLAAFWQQHWAYLQLSGQTPVLVGEFGGRSVDQGTEGTWMRTLMAYLKAHGFSYTYWAWNPDSWDTGGLLTDDWTTLDQSKLDLLTTYQAPLLDAPLQASQPASPRPQGFSPTPVP